MKLKKKSEVKYAGALGHRRSKEGKKRRGKRGWEEVEEEEEGNRGWNEVEEEKEGKRGWVEVEEDEEREEEVG